MIRIYIYMCTLDFLCVYATSLKSWILRCFHLNGSKNRSENLHGISGESNLYKWGV